MNTSDIYNSSDSKTDNTHQTLTGDQKHKNFVIKANDIFRRDKLYDILHIIILLLSVFLVIIISIDTFRNEAFYREPQFMKVQLWICVLFLVDFFIEFFISPNKTGYFWSHLLFLLVSIPYNTIISHYGWHFSHEAQYFIRFIPLIRGGYAMAIVTGWLTRNKATGLFVSYLVTLIVSVYFGSLAFFLFERGHNALVTTYQDALWWACMDATTVGCNIIAVTTAGKILSVVEAAIGLMMFPIFTVYITNLMSRKTPKTDISTPSPTS